MKVSGRRGSNLERFEQSSGCWLWLKSLNERGYGWFYYPHIVSWELHRGGRHGLFVLHNCDNPACVNPDHLRLGTQQDNITDRDKRQRRAPPTGSKNGRTKLTEADILVIRADTRKRRFIAKDWQLSGNTVYRGHVP